MTKIYKNVLVSSELVCLGNAIHPADLNTELSLENTNVSINEFRLAELQNEAYEKGYSAGKEEERRQTEQSILLLKQQLERSLLSIPQAIAQNRLDLKSEIADIILLIIQQFFIEKESNPESLELQINQILTQLNNKQTIELYLHPKEINALKKGSIQLETSHLNGLKIKSDKTLSLGGYVIKTDHGTFDGSIEKQIDRLKEFLLHIKQGEHHATLD